MADQENRKNRAKSTSRAPESKCLTRSEAFFLMAVALMLTIVILAILSTP